MSRAYSLDLRERVVAAVEKGGLSARRAAVQFGSTPARRLGGWDGCAGPAAFGPVRSAATSRESLPGSTAAGCCSVSKRRISPCEAWWLSSAHAA